MNSDSQRGAMGGEFDEFGDHWDLPKGSVKRGAMLFKKHCAQCHSMYPDGRNGLGTSLGPTLFNVCGRVSGEEIAGRARNGTFNSSLADPDRKVVWTDAALMNYMRNPRQTAGGPVYMNFFGIKDVQTRVDIVVFLRTLNWTNEKFNRTGEQGRLPPSSWAQIWYKVVPWSAPWEKA
mmetsp:Transcript_7605/g.16348  ORF Transcript_7605/g.16348 Transcript_7605/m.16348 type:complete len:177 (+) Transcript_7605:45-575(+)